MTGLPSAASAYRVHSSIFIFWTADLIVSLHKLREETPVKILKFNDSILKAFRAPGAVPSGSRSGSPLPPSPPGEKFTAREDHAGQTCACDGTGDSRRGRTAREARHSITSLARSHSGRPPNMNTTPAQLETPRPTPARYLV